MREVPQLGERGGGWVVVQFVLIGVIVVAGVVGPAWSTTISALLAAVGILLALTGGAVAILAARVLGRSLTPYPRPASPATFVERGPYRAVRHPIYLGGLLFLTGFSLASSAWALLATLSLAIVWALKIRIEERFLRARFPEYGGYCERTRYRLVPFVY